ncbi:MAG: sorbosone dehydrogenase family protein [Hyphomicrobiales bacterium]|nr:MAG: sorbosone dehydrogenase family protein [Hyphomicrobiales bacterium]
MNFISDAYARIVAWIGAAMIMKRRWNSVDGPQSFGLAPAIPKAVPQGIPTLKMPTAAGWPAGATPDVAAGLKVNAFARDLKHPRQMLVLPNGDVLVAEALGPVGKPSINAFDLAITATMRRAGAIGESANRITLLRDADGDGVAEERHTLLDNLNHPFGMALVGDTLYVAHMDGVFAYPFTLGETRIKAPGRRLSTYKTHGHWTRNLIVSADQTKLYVSVGSFSNIGDAGMEAEEGRACVFELDIASGQSRLFASGLRNPVGLAIEPTTSALWTVVNERDGIGDETPPDYLTSVKDGGFYGWPYSYWNRIVDDRVKQNPAKVAASLQPDYALGGHTASLGLCWIPDGALPGLGEGMMIGQHGSWNRSKLSGYRMIFVPFANGKPRGEAHDILTGFLSDDESKSFGRPVGTALAKDKAVLLCDDVGDVIWRVTPA